jgi:cyclopropane fatty-acyl-phospholipid synthase-like methyltransferase
MIFNNSLSDSTNQSNYSKNFANYRTTHNTNKNILPHRVYSADYWEETIPLILEYLKSHDLKPHHKILDLGAGGLRSALALVPYLNSNNFFAIDINKYLLEDGYKYEIQANGLQEKFPINHIKVTHDYNGEDFNVKFDYVWSFSLWTHLDKSDCDKCLFELAKILKSGGIYLTTCFIVDNNKYNRPQNRVSDVTIITHHVKDPYHHRLDDFVEIGNKNGFDVEYCGIGKCCPRKHDVVKFTKK